MNDYIDVDFEPASHETRAFSYQGQLVHIQTADRETFWIFLSNLKDILGGINTTTVVRPLSPRMKQQRISPSGQPSWFVSVDGLRDIVSRKRTHKAQCQAFLDWIEDEVLPVLREQPPPPLSSSQALARRETSESALAHAPPTPPMPREQAKLAKWQNGVAAQAFEDYTDAVRKDVLQWKRQLSHVVSNELRINREKLQSHFDTRFDDEVKEATKDLKQAAVEANVAQQKVADLQKENELLERELDVARQERDVAHESYKRHTQNLLDESRQLKARLESALASQKRWRRRARRWGKKLLHIDADAAFDDADLHQLNTGDLDD